MTTLESSVASFRPGESINHRVKMGILFYFGKKSDQISIEYKLNQTTEERWSREKSPSQALVALKKNFFARSESNLESLRRGGEGRDVKEGLNIPPRNLIRRGHKRTWEGKRQREAACAVDEIIEIERWRHFCTSSNKRIEWSTSSWFSARFISWNATNKLWMNNEARAAP